MYNVVLAIIAVIVSAAPVCKDGVCAIPDKVSAVVKAEPSTADQIAALAAELKLKEKDLADAKAAVEKGNANLAKTQEANQAALVKVQEENTKKLVAVQDTLKAATAAQAAAQASCQSILDKISALLGPTPPPPGPSPPPEPPVPPTPTGISLVMVSSDNCPACEVSMPVVKQLQDAGYSVVVTKDAKAWNVGSFPAWIILNNGKDMTPPQRTVGAVGFARLKTWLDQAKAYTNK